jgi:ABC-type sugar transport system ATPase subunit
VCIDGRPINFSNTTAAVRAGLALVPDDRKKLGLFTELSVSSNVGMVVKPRLSRWGRFLPRRELELAERYRRELAIRTPTVAKKAGLLSGGNQQKVVLAKWLAAQPRVLILDEPTRGVDLGAREEIYSIIADLAARGLAVMAISNEIEELMQIASRVVVMRRGEIASELKGNEITEDRIMALALGLENSDSYDRPNALRN